MPLMYLTCKTPLNIFFFAGFCFISGEAEEDYFWALNVFKKHIVNGDIKQSNVIITDKCKTLKNVLLTMILAVPQMLCLFHVN